MAELLAFGSLLREACWFRLPPGRFPVAARSANAMQLKPDTLRRAKVYAASIAIWATSSVPSEVSDSR